MATIGRRAYAEMYGPTVGDRLRLADTALVIEVEDDYTLRAGGYGEEVRRHGKQHDAREQHGLARVARDVRTCGQSGDADAEREERGQCAHLRQREAEGRANVGGQDADVVAVRRHQYVANQQQAEHGQCKGSRS